MAAGDAAHIIATELEHVATEVPVLFDRDDTFYSTIEKRPVEKISERDMRIPLELRPGGKFRHFSSDNSDMGRGDMPTYDKAVINTIELEFAVEYSTRVEWATDDKRKAVIDAFQRTLASAMSEFRRNVDSVCMTGGDGVLGTISAVSTGGSPSTDTYTLGTDGFGARLLRFGQDINVYAADLMTKRTSSPVTILYHDLVGKQIKVLAVGGAIPTDKIVADGLTATPPVSILGLPYHHSGASTGYWLGFNRATTPEIRANSVDAGGSALTLPWPRLAINKIGDRIGKNRMKKLTAWTHPCQQDQYEQLAVEMIQINKKAEEEGIDLYFSNNMRLAGCPLKTSYSWDKTRIDFVDTDVWGRAEMHAPDFYKDKNGNRYFAVRGTSGGVQTSNLFYIVASFNLFVTSPPACSYIYGLAVPSGY